MALLACGREDGVGTALDDSTTAFRPTTAQGRSRIGIQQSTPRNLGLLDDKNFNGLRMYYKLKLKPARRMCTDVDLPNENNFSNPPLTALNPSFPTLTLTNPNHPDIENIAI